VKNQLDGDIVDDRSASTLLTQWPRGRLIKAIHAARARFSRIGVAMSSSPAALCFFQVVNLRNRHVDQMRRCRRHGSSYRQTRYRDRPRTPTVRPSAEYSRDTQNVTFRIPELGRESRAVCYSSSQARSEQVQAVSEMGDRLATIDIGRKLGEGWVPI